MHLHGSQTIVARFADSFEGKMLRGIQSLALTTSLVGETVGLGARRHHARCSLGYLRNTNANACQLAVILIILFRLCQVHVPQ